METRGVEPGAERLAARLLPLLGETAPYVISAKSYWELKTTPTSLKHETLPFLGGFVFLWRLGGSNP